MAGLALCGCWIPASESDRTGRERLAEGKVGRGIADERLQVVMGTHRYAVFHGWNRVPLGHISQLAVDTAGRVYVFQRTGAPIVVLTPDGDLAASWDAAPISDPHGIFITSDDRVLLLVDRNAHQVLIFATDGQLLTTL